MGAEEEARKRAMNPPPLYNPGVLRNKGNAPQKKGRPPNPFRSIKVKPPPISKMTATQRAHWKMVLKNAGPARKRARHGARPRARPR